MLVTRALSLDPKRAGDLADDRQKSGAGDESGHHGFRNVARHVPEPRDGDDDLHDADHDREQEHGLICVELGVGIDEGERAEDDERNRARRAVDEMP